MLILPPGHAQAVASRRHLKGRERWVAGSAAVVAIALAVVIGVSLAAGGHSARRGCLDVTYASSTGALTITGCGSSARAICAADGTPRGYSGLVAVQVARRCRELGLRVG